MFIPLSDLIGCQISAADKAAGTVEDVYIDDILWTVRHLAVNDAGGLGTQPASIDPDGISGFDPKVRTIATSLSQAEVAGGPDISSDLPVAKQSGGKGDPHLRSIRELDGYQVHGTDGEAGVLSGFIADDVAWKIHFVIVDTGYRQVLLAPGLFNQIDFGTKRVHLEVDRKHVVVSPDYDPDTPIEREEDIELVGRAGV